MILRSVSGESPAFCMFDPLGGSIGDASALTLVAIQIQALMMGRLRRGIGPRTKSEDDKWRGPCLVKGVIGGII